MSTLLPTLPTLTTLTRLKDDIEQFERSSQARALRILTDNDVPYDENPNGVFVNMSNIPTNVVDKLDKYVTYVKLQQQFLQDQELEKEVLRQNYFKPPQQEHQPPC
jgi:hypothetical protein